jgi:CBS domain-containing protein
MTRRLVKLHPDQTIRDAMEQLAAHHVSGAPVVSGGKVLGVVSATDLLDFASSLPGVPSERPTSMQWDSDTTEDDAYSTDEPLASFFLDLWDDAGATVAERYASATGPEWNMLEEHSVSEAMTRGPICSLPPTATVTQAADYMQRAGVHRILVMDGDDVVGIVSSSDVARAAAEGKLGKRVYVFPSDGRTANWEERE